MEFEKLLQGKLMLVSFLTQHPHPQHSKDKDNQNSLICAALMWLRVAKSTIQGRIPEKFLLNLKVF